MDFKLLASAKEKLESEINSGHAEVSDLSTFQGFCCLLSAEQLGFRDREILKKAADAFAIGIQYNRKNPLPLLGLAYLFLLVKDPQNAAPYLARAQELDPDHPDLGALMGWLEGKTSKPDPDTDAQLEKLEMLLAESLKRYLASKPLPAVDPNRYLRLQEEHLALQELCQNLQRDLKQFQADSDNLGLEQQLQSLMAQLKPFEQAIKVSQDYLRLLRQMKTDVSETEALYQRLPLLSEIRELNAIEQSLEYLLDRCDGFADRLDDYDQKGFDIQAVETVYHELCRKIEALQEGLEENLSRLQPLMR